MSAWRGSWPTPSACPTSSSRSGAIGSRPNREERPDQLLRRRARSSAAALLLCGQPSRGVSTSWPGTLCPQSQRLDDTAAPAFEGGRLRFRGRGNSRRAVSRRRGAHRSADAGRRCAGSRAQRRSRASSRKPGHAGAPNPIASFFAFTRMRREVALARRARAARRDRGGGVAAASRRGAGDAVLSLPLRAGRRSPAAHGSAGAPLSVVRADLPIGTKQPGWDDPAVVRRDALGLLRLIAGQPSRLVARGAVAARAARALTGRSAQLAFLPKVMHLLDVERAALAANGAERRIWDATCEVSTRRRLRPARRGHNRREGRLEGVKANCVRAVLPSGGEALLSASSIDGMWPAANPPRAPGSAVGRLEPVAPLLQQLGVRAPRDIGAQVIDRLPYRHVDDDPLVSS